MANGNGFYLPVIGMRKAPPDVQAVYRQVLRQFPMLPGVFQAFSTSPEHLFAMWRAWDSTMRAGPMPRFARELVAVSVSRANACTYCIDAHGMYLAGVGFPPDRVQHLSTAAAQLDPYVQPLVAFGRDLARAREPLSGDAVRAAWDKLGLIQATAVAAWFCVFNRVVDALGVVPFIPAPVRWSTGVYKLVLHLGGRLEAWMEKRAQEINMGEGHRLRERIEAKRVKLPGWLTSLAEHQVPLSSLAGLLLPLAADGPLSRPARASIVAEALAAAGVRSCWLVSWVFDLVDDLPLEVSAIVRQVVNAPQHLTANALHSLRDQGWSDAQLFDLVFTAAAAVGLSRFDLVQWDRAQVSQAFRA